MSKKTREVLKMIAEDMKTDAENFDGKPFNGRTVAEYFGNHGAAIAALAEIVLQMDIKEELSKRSYNTSTDIPFISNEDLPDVLKLLRKGETKDE